MGSPRRRSTTDILCLRCIRVVERFSGSERGKSVGIRQEVQGGRPLPRFSAQLIFRETYEGSYGLHRDVKHKVRTLGHTVKGLYSHRGRRWTDISRNSDISSGHELRCIFERARDAIHSTVVTVKPG